MKKPRGILIDLGNTILTEQKFDRDNGTARLLEFAHNREKVDVRLVRILVDELDQEIRPRRYVSMIEYPTIMFQRMLYERLGVQFAVNSEELEKEFWKAALTIWMEEGVEEALEAIEKHNIPIGILTNSTFSGAVLMDELHNQGIDQKIKFLMSSADYGLRKPHPFVFITAAAKLGIEPADIWFVGDSLREDVVGSLGVGMTAVWYNPMEEPCAGTKPHMEFNHWKDFPKLLEES